jgi:glucose-6-phosphate 1-dehydrogenase
MQGDATLFTRRDEVDAEWQIISPIEEAWAQLPPPDFPNYAAGSDAHPRGMTCSNLGQRSRTGHLGTHESA